MSVEDPPPQDVLGLWKAEEEVLLSEEPEGWPKSHVSLLLLTASDRP